MEIFSSLSTNPFFSSIITLYTIILLYLPSYFIGLIFSPVFISTFTLVLYLLRLGATQEENKKELNSAGVVTEEFNSTGSVFDDEEIVPEELNSAPTQPPLQQVHEFSNNDHKWNSCQGKEEAEGVKNGSSSDHGSGPFYVDSFLEWDVRAPLEVIYEAHEGEEEEEHSVDVLKETQKAIIEKYASLSMCYPETDTDTSSSEADFPLIEELDSAAHVGFRWEEEDGEGLIEIALDGKRKHEVEEENLIEIDLLRRVSRPDEVFCRRVNDGFSEEFRYN